MVTRAEIISINYNLNTCSVRIPLIETANSSMQILEATISTLPGACNNYSAGDIVYVAFNNGNYSQPVVIGKLYINATAEIANDRGNLSCNSLNVTSTAAIPISTKLITQTTLGEISTNKSFENITSISDIIIKLNDLENLISLQKSDYLSGTFYCVNATTNIFGKTDSRFSSELDDTANSTGNIKILYDKSLNISQDTVYKYMQLLTGKLCLPESHTDSSYGVILCFKSTNELYYIDWKIEEDDNKYLTLVKIN